MGIRTTTEADLLKVFRELDGHPAPRELSHPTGNLESLHTSLDAKRELVTLLEKGGYLPSRNAEAMRKEINFALSELENIIHALDEQEVSR